jgi:hypothetical protein
MRVPEYPCVYCDEIVKLEDNADVVLTPEGPRPAHPECNFRAIMGSVAHIEKRCDCYVPGSTDHDPPDMTKREAAKAAVRAWHRSHGRVEH